MLSAYFGLSKKICTNESPHLKSILNGKFETSLSTNEGLDKGKWHKLNFMDHLRMAQVKRKTH